MGPRIPSLLRRQTRPPELASDFAPPICDIQGGKSPQPQNGLFLSCEIGRNERNYHSPFSVPGADPGGCIKRIPVLLGTRAQEPRRSTTPLEISLHHYVKPARRICGVFNADLVELLRAGCDGGRASRDTRCGMLSVTDLSSAGDTSSGCCVRAEYETGLSDIEQSARSRASRAWGRGPWEHSMALLDARA